MSVSSTAPSPTPAPYSERMTDLPGPVKSSEDKDLTLFAEGDDEPSFWDALDVINPLQHIPVVNQIYRELTGDKIGVGARMAGGTLFGGVVGLVVAVADCAVESATGDDVGGHVMALFRDGEAPADGETAIAAKQPDSQPAAAQAQTAAASPAAAQAAPSVIPGPMATPGMAALTAAAPKAAASAQPAAAQAAMQKPIPLTGPLPAAAPQAVSPLTAAKPGPIPGPIATPGLLTMAQAAGQQTGQTIADATAQDLALQAQAALSGQDGKDSAAKPITVAQADPGTLQTFDGAPPTLQQNVKFRPVPQRTGPATPKAVAPPHEASLLGVGSRQVQPASLRQAAAQPPADQAAPMPPSPAPAAPGQADWFANNVMQGLEKYQQPPKSKP